MENESDPQNESVLKPNLYFAQTSSFHFKQFIKESDPNNETRNETISYPIIPKVSGSVVRKDYDEIVCDASTSCEGEKRVNERKLNCSIKKKKCKPFNKPLTVHALMKAVEIDDERTVSEYIAHDSNFVINSRDQYGWTTIMCASCAGAERVVKLLLKLNPDLFIKDKKENDCLSLAKNRGHHRITELLEYHINSLASVDEVSSKNIDGFSRLESCQTKEEAGTFYCETCKEHVLTSAKHSHLTSTMHNFNAARKSGLKTSYGISESNVGFQMLLKTGWDREKGLGPGGEGHKFPPKVMLKQDRTGLGVKKYVAKVTHNIDDDRKKARTERLNTINKRHKEKKERNDRMKERELRRLLS